MNQIVIYEFTIKAVSPVYFGDSHAGELVTDAEDRPVVLGNSIGGALRDYLKRIAVPKKTISKYMGEKRKDGEEAFQESGIYISDGNVRLHSGICEKEGTAVDPAYGTAADKQKYALKHLPEGTELSFRIECDEWTKGVGEQKEKLDPSELEKLIGTWARGIDEQRLCLGGQKSNGFGKFKLERLQKTVFTFENSRDLDAYIFDRHRDNKAERVNIEDLPRYEPQKNRITLSMAGSFPYGVYQGYSIPWKDSEHTLTGLQKKQDRYFLPSTSVKGLMRNEVRLLIGRMIGSGELVEKKCCELFGSTEQRGKLVFSDLSIEEGRKVEIKRYERDGNEPEPVLKEGAPAYNKIDRLTGGAYHTALKHQQEIQGKAMLRIELTGNHEEVDDNPYIFPLVYVLRRIGSGLVPLGGRTVIGLGEFSAGKVNVASEHASFAVETGALSKESRERLEKLFESFKGWCSRES